MKKNIIIAGTARAGKSTLCSILSSQYGYQHISLDAIIEGIEDNFPEVGIDTHTDSITKISKKIGPFINSMITSGEYDKFNHGMVIDVCQLMPEDFINDIGDENCDIYYLITGDISPEERLNVLEEFDNELEYTFKKSKIEKLKLCIELVDESRLFKSQCEHLGLNCIDTLYDRESKLTNICNMISKSIGEEDIN